MREAVAKKEFMMIKDFIDSKESIYHTGWKITPWNVLRWGLKQLGLAGGVNGEDKLVVAKVVIVGNLEEAGKKVAGKFEEVTGRVERIFSRSTFAEAYGHAFGDEKKLSENDLEVLLRFMARDKGLLSYDKNMVKLKAPNEETPSPITQEDITIASLKSLIKDLETQTALLNRRFDQLGLTAKEAVASKNRIAALAALKSKKLAETTLSKRTATLSQLEEVLSKIEQAADQVDLIRVMEASTKVLTGLNKEVGGIERVDDVVDQLREQMTQVDEVGNVIAEAGQSGVVDEGEVDDELEAMEREERVKREEEERMAKEEKERKEAEVTRRRLDALAEVERQAKEAAKKAEEAKIEEEIEKSGNMVKQMSLEESPAHIPA